MGIIEAILVAASLCTDCFAVSLCSSVTLKKIEAKSVLRVALSFAVIQTGLLLAGWLFGNLFVGMISTISHIVGFLLLAYVGGSMLIEGIRGEGKTQDLNGWKNITLGGIATSIDALAVGVAQSMEVQACAGVLPLLISVFVITFGAVIGGIFGGRSIGHKFGSRAEITGGIILVTIGIFLLF